MKTKPLYLEDPYKKNLDTKILEVIDSGNNEFKLILESTIFYPMGGGQPTDQGIITAEHGTEFKVFQVQVIDGEILHFIKSEEAPKAGIAVTSKIDWARRYKNMQVHTAGHIIDFARYSIAPDLQPVKGDHGKKAFITYSGKLSILNFGKKLQEKVNDLVKSGLGFSWKFTSFENVEKNALYLQPGLPKNKPLRMLTLEKYGSVADGGTICKNTSEVGSILITSVGENNGEVKISYKVEPEIKDDSKINTTKTTQVRTVELPQNVQILFDDAEKKVEGANDEESLTELWREFLGKQGKVKGLMSKISEIPKEQKKDYGKNVNEIKDRIDQLINSKKEAIKTQKIQSYLSKKQGELDSSKPKVGHLHPLTQTEQELNRILGRIGYSIYDGPELETYEYNFKRCNVPEDHPALDLQDSIYVREPDVLLRTQTSSIEAHALEELKPPFKIIMPGRSYRNEKVNATNHFVFHQYQLVCVMKEVSLADLLSTIDYLFKEYLGEDVVTRYRNKYYPEVEPGVGPDMQCFNCGGEGCAVCKNRGWMEMGGAGIIHPNIMRMAGLDTNKWQGFAFGLGLDRWAMAKHKITDIRTLLGGNLAYMPSLDL